MQPTQSSRSLRLLRRYIHAAQLQFALNVSSKPAVKVYGLLRTGTNYMTKLLELNFKVFTLQSTEYGWKHGPCEPSKNIQYIFIVKNPYSWMRSFWEWETIHLRTETQTLEDFMTRDVSHPELRRCWNLGTPIDAWNISLESWLSIKDSDNVEFIKYEDLLAEFDKQMGALQTRLGLTARQSTFRNLESRADSWKTPQPRKALKTDYYRNEQYINEFSDAELRIMRDNLNPSVARALGYKIY